MINSVPRLILVPIYNRAWNATASSDANPDFHLLSCWRHPSSKITHMCEDCKTNRYFCLNCAYEDKTRFPHHRHVRCTFNFPERLARVKKLLGEAKDVASEYLEYERLISAASCELDEDINRAKDQVRGIIDKCAARLEAVKSEIFRQLDEMGQDLTKKHRQEMQRFGKYRDMVDLAELLIASAISTNDLRLANKITSAEEILSGIVSHPAKPRHTHYEGIIYKPLDLIDFLLGTTEGKLCAFIGSTIIKRGRAIHDLQKAPKKVILGEQHHLLQNWRSSSPFQPTSVAYFQSGDARFLYLLSEHGAIQRLDINSQIMDKSVQCFSPCHQNSTVNHENQIKISEDGMIAVLHYHGNAIYLMTSDMNLQKKVSTVEFIHEQGNSAIAIDFDKVGQLFILTYAPQYIFIISKEGKPISKVTPHPTVENTFVFDQLHPLFSVSPSDATKPIQQFSRPAPIFGTVAQQPLRSIPPIFTVTDHSRIFFLRQFNIDIYSLEGKHIKSVSTEGRSFSDILSCSPGLVMLVDVSPVFLDNDGNKVTIQSPQIPMIKSPQGNSGNLKPGRTPQSLCHCHISSNQLFISQSCSGVVNAVCHDISLST